MKATSTLWVALTLAINPAWAESGPTNGMESDLAAAKASVVIAPETIQSIGVRTENAALASFGTNIRSYGLVTENVRNTYVISSRVAGWIEDLEITAVGDEVRKGDLLFTLYSPDLISAQQDYLAAIAAGNKGRINSSAKRLQSLGVGEKALKQIKAERRKLEQLPFYAETTGTVSQLMANKGSYVTPGMQIANIQDYRSVWIEVSVAEKDLQFLEKGGKATVTFPNLGNVERIAQIDYIYPTIDLDSRTGQVRLVLGNRDGTLKPGAYTDVLFETHVEKRLSIPSEAILKSSEGDFVIVALGEGRFQSQRIQTGIHNKGRTEVVHGLEEGEKIVVSSQFLIDSESALRESFRKLQKVQTPLALLEVSKEQLAMLDQLVNAALHLHEAEIATLDPEPEILKSALRLNHQLLSEFRGTKLQFILEDSDKALAAALDAITKEEQRHALAGLVAALKSWVAEGQPKHYKDKGIRLYLDHGTGNYWLQSDGEMRHPYGEGHAVQVELPDEIKGVEPPVVTAPAGGGHAHH